MNDVQIFLMTSMDLVLFSYKKLQIFFVNNYEIKRKFIQLFVQGGSGTMRSQRKKSNPPRYGRRWGQNGYCGDMRDGKKDPEQTHEGNINQVTRIRIH